MKENSKYYKIISEETGLSEIKIDIIVKHQFAFLKRKMQEDGLQGVLLHGLGTFRARRGRIDFLIKKLIWRLRKKSGNDLELKEKWENLVSFISKEFGNGETLDLQAILFLIGIQELGKGYRSFSKEEKTDLLHIAICRLLSNYGYYEFEGRDKDGWPHYLTNEKLPPLKPGEQTILMKEAAIMYFEERGVNF